MVSKKSVPTSNPSDWISDFTPTNPLIPFWAYSVDCWQRNVLFLDTLRKRGNQYVEHAAKPVPHVLQFEYEKVMDGRDLERPVNYGLVRILPGKGIDTDPEKRAFVVVDPRAGHGPGIGGFKPDSEIGAILKAGHPCYFIGFLAEPVHGQTIEDVGRAEALFLEHVGEQHPSSEGKPCIIGNCQAGWALMMLAAVRPELVGPVMIAGAPLSYWAGVRGENPMRYLGGLVGGTWMTAMTGDLGNGIFDGAHLVTNFEGLNPANTLWSKQYNLWSKIDTEADRFLEFERWWGGHVLLGAHEMQYIADELFVGNKLTQGGLQTSDGRAIDLRNVKSPIIVFCSWGDNITPPQQALHWIVDLYESVDEIRAFGQTIVYAVHESIGHLGIFVSGSVGKKEHDQFTQNMDLIDALPPGLYEIQVREKTSADKNADLAYGDYIIAFEERTIDDIKNLGNPEESDDDNAFRAVARLSEINKGLYSTFVSPWIRQMVTDDFAGWMRETHPARVQYMMYSDQNPWMGWVGSAADAVRENRESVEADNPAKVAEQALSKSIVQALNHYRDFRDKAMEQAFFGFYGSDYVQALLGLKGEDKADKASLDPARAALLKQKQREVEAQIGEGGWSEALVRSILYVGIPDGIVDERGFAALKKIHSTLPKSEQLSLTDFKALVHQQFMMLRHDEEACLNTLPSLLPNNPEKRQNLFNAIETVLGSAGIKSKTRDARLAKLKEYFDLAGETVKALPKKQPQRRSNAGSSRPGARS